MLIGLTGQIGAGKSTVAGMLRKRGAHIIDADQIGRDVVNQSAPLRRKLARRFGADILDSRGRLNRSLLAERAFESESTHAALNVLVHPYLLKELRRQAKTEQKRHRIVVIDAALLLDWQMDREVDLVILVDAPQALRLRRMAARGISPAAVRSRQRRQLPLAEYRRRSDATIVNNNDINKLRQQVKLLWQRRIALPD